MNADPADPGLPIDVRPGRAWSRAIGWLAVLLAVAALAATVLAWADGDWRVAAPWIPTLGLSFELAFDGLAILYAFLATGIGLLVFVYATAYIPHHLESEDRPAIEARRFWLWMVVFLVAMVGLAASQNLILLFVFFDLTAIASYFLIGFDRHRADARGAAMVSLVVTGGSAVAMLIGAVLLGTEYGTFSIPTLIESATSSPTTAAACALIGVAALAKSAQVPLHFWLPRAMAAPTPVSAYLHSAAMVAAGVLVIGRIHPLIALEPVLLDALIVIGFGSILIGGVLALGKDELKQVLAHSTISQYGYVVVLYGIGGEAGAAGAALYVLAHGIAKSALFLSAGAVMEATGESQLSRLGGLARGMPVLAIATGVAAASLAALPLTIGFFKDELFFAAAIERGALMQAAAVLSAGLTLSYIGRYWLGVFAGRRRSSAHPISWTLVGPIVVLAILSVAGGLAVEPFAVVAGEAAGVIAGTGTPVEVEPAYHLDSRPENVMAVLAWVTGAALLAVAPARDRIAGWLVRAGDRFGPRHVYGMTLDAIDRLSEAVHREEVRDLRTSLGAVLVPAGILGAIGFAATPSDGSYSIGAVRIGDLPLVVLLVLAVAAAIATARDTGRLRPVLALSVLGFALAGVYAIIGAPDVALVAVVIETVLSLIFVAVFARLPATAVRDSPSPRALVGRYRNAAAGVIAGISAFAVIWTALSRPPLGAADSEAQIDLTPAAHGGDVVTVILADFRGLDTMVEITVLAVAVIGVTSLLRRERVP